MIVYIAEDQIKPNFETYLKTINNVEDPNERLSKLNMLLKGIIFDLDPLQKFNSIDHKEVIF